MFVPFLGNEPVATVSDPTAGDAAFDVVLKSAGGTKLAVVRVIIDNCGLSLSESRYIVSKAPVVVNEKVSKTEAEALKTALENVGANVEIK